MLTDGHDLCLNLMLGPLVRNEKGFPPSVRISSSLSQNRPFWSTVILSLSLFLAMNALARTNWCISSNVVWG